MERATKKLIDILINLNPQCIFLVTGKNSFSKICKDSSLIKVVLDYNYVQFSEFETNPKIEDVKKGVSLFKKQKCDLIVAIGGGSVMDMAKLVTFFSKKKDTSIEFLGEKLNEKQVCPLIAIPTTAGSGSEATHFAVVYSSGQKYSCTDKRLQPAYVILEPTFLKHLNSYQLACSGMDALSQGIEAYWNINSNEHSDQLALESIRLIWENLPSLVNNIKDNFEDILIGANLAGRAINITKTTGPHAVSYPFTTHFHIPHGHAVSLTLGYFLEYNYNAEEWDCNEKRGLGFVKNKLQYLANFLGFSDVLNLRLALNKFLISININIDLRSQNIDLSKIEKFVMENINEERLKNNPRRFDYDDLLQFLLR